MMPALEVRGIRKQFPGVLALDGVDLDLHAGEVHALAGENGAGKSSLIKVLCGIHRPDAGTMRLGGEPYSPRTPLQAMRSGIRVVHQELLMLDQLSVAENLLFDALPRTAGIFVDRAALRTRARELLAVVGLDDLDPDRKVEGLGMAHRQLIEIAKAVSTTCRILVLDEPTATLTSRETERLFGIVQRLRADGVAMLFVSHHLQEIFEICDRVTVLRNGRLVQTMSIGDTSPDHLVRTMVGRDLQPAAGTASVADVTPDAIAGGASGTVAPNAPALRVHGLRYAGQPAGASIDLTVMPGEIVGMAGLVGSGRSETVRAIFGADRRVAGRIERDGREVDVRAPADAIAAGICLVTEDRKDEGLVLDMPVRDNITLASLAQHARAGWIDRRAERESSESMVRSMDIRLAGIGQHPRELSGGNQQKVVLARWLLCKPGVLILDEPTRGVDVGAKAEIHALLRQIARAGAGVLMVSSDLPELMGACDRIVVMSRGCLAGEVPRSAFDEESILQLAYREYLHA